jgi:error-prone DNA polymerase
LVKGLTRVVAERLVVARRQAPLLSVTDLARRAGVRQSDLRALAAAGALAALTGDRHQAAWQVIGVEESLPLVAYGEPGPEPEPSLPIPTEGENILADYAMLGLTLERHPLALLRGHLGRRGLMSAAEVCDQQSGRRVRAAGIVIGRQRPASANSVTFVTLEDETGQINLVVWKQLAERQRAILLQARLLGVIGEVQREGAVVHVIARRLRDYTPLLGGLRIRSRDFH